LRERIYALISKRFIRSPKDNCKFLQFGDNFGKVGQLVARITSELAIEVGLKYYPLGAVLKYDTEQNLKSFVTEFECLMMEWYVLSKQLVPPQDKNDMCDTK
jgi:hypothetical protein